MDIEDKFRYKYRVPSARLKHHNYSFSGYYYITICTYNRINYFGNIKDNEMKLSDVGQIAGKYWLKIPEYFPFVELYQYVIMPNHVHGILRINNSVETRYLASHEGKEYQNRFGPQSNNLASIVRGYKSGVKKWAIENDIGFAWQPRFYDHIIRNNASLNAICKYIMENPSHWSEDEENVAVNNKKNKNIIRDAKCCVSTGNP